LLSRVRAQRIDEVIIVAPFSDSGWSRRNLARFQAEFWRWLAR